MTNKVKKYNWFHYSLTGIRLCTFILLELNIFLKKYYAKSGITLSLTIYIECKMTILLRVDFAVSLS